MSPPTAILRVIVATLLFAAYSTPGECASLPHDGLVVWLDATDVDGDGDPANQPADGSALDRWADKSGQGNHIAQSTAERQPTIERWRDGDAPAVRFHGDDCLRRDHFEGFTVRDQPMHVAIVTLPRASSTHTMARLIEFQPVDGDLSKPATVKQHGFWIGPRNDGRMRLGTHYGDEGAAQSVAFDSDPHLVEVVYRGAQNWVHYLDGSRDGGGLFGDRDFHGFTKDLRFAVGQLYGSSESDTYYDGDVAEILIYNRPLSADEQNSLKTYLSEKWSLDLSIEPVPQFERDVLPILAENCHDCHGEDVQEAGVDLRTVAAMLRGGKTGPVIARGRPEFSELVELISHRKMPPEDADPLTDDQIATIRHWIASGCPSDEAVESLSTDELISDEDRQFWAYQKLAHREPPAASKPDRVRTPIDAFVLARLEALGLSFAADADRVTLARRVYFDLIGLPPSPEEIDAFLADESPDAYERLIDRLLESRHFGERWGRSWLDWSGYVDVYGKDNDFAIIKPLEGRWRFRDYVIDSFNSGKPFDQFLVEQLAGDELVDWRNAQAYTPEIVELLTATGFLLCSDDDTDQNELNTPDIRHHVLQNTGEIVANNLFGLTLQCAHCHNHKYEAIPQVDYYRWLAIFSPIFNPQRWVTSVEHGIPDVSKAEKQAIDQHNGEIDRQVAELNGRRDALRAQCRERVFNKKLAALPEAIRDDVKTAVATPEEKRSEVQKYLAAKLGKQLDVSSEEVDAALSESDRASIAQCNEQIGALNAKRQSYGTIQVAVEQSPPSATYLLRRGQVKKPGMEVPPSSLSILDLDEFARAVEEAQVQGESSGRRLALARQVTNPDTIAGSLVARVFVNRVWQELLGKGIVETSDNLGVSGSRPTHPELLDWLASEFLRGGWRVKPLIRQIMTSSVYRQSSIRPDAAVAEQADPANDLLWRARLRRLESEAVRDSVLATSGQLDRTLGGPPAPLLARPDGKIVIDTKSLPTPTSHLRRSLYVLNRRHYHLSFLTTFDQPFLTDNCTVRQPAAVVTQALTMMNDDFIVEQARHFADRVAAEANSASPEDRVDRAFQLALGREPSADERLSSVELIERHTERFAAAGAASEEAATQALAQLCQVLFNTSEFLYVP